MNFLSKKQAAEILNISTVQLNRLITKGIVKAQMVGHQYIIFPDEVESYQKNRRPAGRPKKMESSPLQENLESSITKNVESFTIRENGRASALQEA